MISNPHQIAILAYVLREPKRKLTFQQLKVKTNLTDGNLASCIRTLEFKGMVTVWKGFNGRKPFTEITILDKGENAILEYADWFNRLIAEVDCILSE